MLSKPALKMPPYSIAFIKRFIFDYTVSSIWCSDSFVINLVTMQNIFPHYRYEPFHLIAYGLFMWISSFLSHTWEAAWRICFLMWKKLSEGWKSSNHPPHTLLNDTKRYMIQYTVILRYDMIYYNAIHCHMIQYNK